MVDMDERRKAGSSAGAVVEVYATGVPPGLGAPVYDKLSADVAKAIVTGGVKGAKTGAIVGAALGGGAATLGEGVGGVDPDLALHEAVVAVGAEEEFLELVDDGFISDVHAEVGEDLGQRREARVELRHFG